MQQWRIVLCRRGHALAACQNKRGGGLDGAVRDKQVQKVLELGASEDPCVAGVEVVERDTLEVEDGLEDGQEVRLKDQVCQ